jgi:hypothetical protein
MVEWSIMHEYVHLKATWKMISMLKIKLFFLKHIQTCWNQFYTSRINFTLYKCEIKHTKMMFGTAIGMLSW